MRILAEQLRDPGGGDREIEVEGATWYVRKSPQPGVELTVSVGSADAVPMIARFEAASAPPERYPADVPFMPGYAAAVTRDPQTSGTLMVMWTPVPDPALLVREVEAASLGEGWQVVDRLDAFGTAAVELERAGSIRIVSAGPAGAQQVVTLAQGAGRGRNR